MTATDRTGSRTVSSPGIVLEPGGAAGPAGPGATGATAWYAVRLTSVVPSGPGAAATTAADAAYLTGQAVPDGTRFALRVLRRPGADLQVALVGRVDADSAAGAVAAATAARSRLAVAPAHVRATPVTADDEVRWLLSPFEPVPAGMGEVRKETVVRQPGRPDAGVSYYLGVLPLAADRQDWAPLVRALRAHPAPVCLSVGLTPSRLPADFPARLRGVEANYARLGTDTVTAAGQLYRGRRYQAGDPLARTMAGLYADAAARYGGPVFRLRVALASPAPYDDGLLALVAATVGAARGAERPAGPDDGRAFVAHFAALAGDEWGGHPVWRQGPRPPRSLRRLADVVDAAEAAVAFRLPDVAEPVGLPAVRVADVPTAAGRRLPLGRLAGREPAEPLVVPAADADAAVLLGPPAETERWADALLAAFEPGTPVRTVGGGRHDPVPPVDAFAVPAGTPVGAHVARLGAVLTAAAGLGEVPAGLLRAALSGAYQARGLSAADLGTPGAQRVGLGDLVRGVWAETHRGEVADPAGCELLRQFVQGLLEGPAAALLGPPAQGAVVRLGDLAPYPAARAVTLALLADRAAEDPAGRVLLREPAALLASPRGALLDLVASRLAAGPHTAARYLLTAADPASLPAWLLGAARLTVLARLPAGPGAAAAAAVARLSPDQQADVADLPTRYAYVTAAGLPEPVLAVLDLGESP